MASRTCLAVGLALPHVTTHPLTSWAGPLHSSKSQGPKGRRVEVGNLLETQTLEHAASLSPHSIGQSRVTRQPRFKGSIFKEEKALSWSLQARNSLINGHFKLGQGLYTNREQFEVIWCWEQRRGYGKSVTNLQRVSGIAGCYCKCTGYFETWASVL